MQIKPTLSPGVLSAIGAAALFGCGTPLAKLLLGTVSPWMLAGLFYLGSGVGLFLFRLLRRSLPVKLASGEWKWPVGATIFGGVIGPVLLMFGLTNMPASGASLLLNAEGVFTALLAWFAFKENFDRRIAVGMGAIVLGAIVLSWPDSAQPVGMWPSLAVLGACFAWGLDNNLTRKVSLSDATWLASVKGLAAGTVNLALAFALGAVMPSPLSTASAMVVGCLAYGISLTLFVVALRYLGTARTGAYFSLAPFFGAAVSITVLDETVTFKLLAAAALMGVGIWLHLTERHQHVHRHAPLEHEHEHEHDEHHPHGHADPQGRHTHWHRHDELTHEHPHFPDAHHRHSH